jgi:hypothetical protein
LFDTCDKETAMPTEYWKGNKDIHDRVMKLVGDHHPDLALVVEEIVVVFRSKGSKSGGQVILGTPKKATPLANALSGEEYKFILEIAADQWEHSLDSKQQEALLDHLLCACRCEEDAEKGETKFSVVKPPVQVFPENIERYGMWFPKEDEKAEGAATAIEEILAEE